MRFSSRVDDMRLRCGREGAGVGITRPLARELRRPRLKLNGGNRNVTSM